MRRRHARFLGLELMESRLLLHGQNAATATPLELDAEIGGTFATGTENDWFSFAAKANTAYQVESDAGVFVKNAEGQRLFSSSRGSMRVFDVPTDQDVFLVMAPLVNTETQDFETEYTLSIRAFDDDHGNTLRTATVLTPNEPERFTTSTRFDTDIFKFEAKANTDYLLQFETEPIPPFGGLHFVSFTTIIEPEPADRASRPQQVSADTSVHSFRLDSDQVVYFEVLSRNSLFFGETNELTIKISEVSEIDQGPNDLGSARELKIGTTNPGLIETPTDVDWFKFTGAAETAYLINVPSYLSQAQVTLFRSDGSRIESGDQSPFRVDTESKDEEIFVKVSSATSENSSGIFRYEVAILPFVDGGGDIGDAQPIEVHEEIVDQRDENQASEWFTFTAEASTAYQLTSTNAVVSVVLADGTPVGQYSAASSELLYFEDETQLYANVLPRYDRYQLLLSEIIDDHGNDIGSATRHNICSTFLLTPNDEDWFFFNAKAGREYWIDARQTSLSLWSADGQPIQEVRNDSTWTSSSDAPVYVRTAPNSETGLFNRAELTIVDVEAADSFPDDPANAHWLVLPSGSGERIQTPDDHDWFIVTLPKGVQRIEATNLSHVRVLDADGVELAKNDPGEPWVDIDMAEEGDVLIDVSHDGFNQSYSIRFHPDDHADEQGSATHFEESIDGNILLPSDKDWFTVSLSKGAHSIRADISSIRIVDGEGRELARNLEGRTTAFVELQEPADVFIELSDDRDDHSYTLRVSTVAELHGNSIADATAITDQTTRLWGQMNYPGDIDVFSLEADAGTLWYATTSMFRTAPNTSLRILDAAGNVVDSISKDVSNFTFIVPETGTYFAEIRNLDPSSLSNYYLDLFPIQDDHSNELVNATPIDGDIEQRRGVTLNLAFDYPSDSDVFVFEAIGGRAYGMESHSEAELTAYDKNGRQLGSSTTGKLFVDAAVDGSIYIELTGDSRRNDTLTIQGYDDDHGNSIETATPIEDLSSITGTFDLRDEADYFSFHAEPALYFVWFGGVRDLTVFDVHGVELEPILDEFGYITFRVEQPQTVFLRAMDGPEYRMQVLAVDGDDHGNSSDDATPIDFGLPIAGVNEFPFDSDVFSFQAEPGVSYRVENTLQPRWATVTDEDGNLYSPSERDHTIVEVDTPRTIYITSSASGLGIEYNVLVSSFVDDHSRLTSQATPLELGTSVPGELHIWDDRDVFRFDATAGGTYLVSIEDTERSAEATVYTEDGERIGDLRASDSLVIRADTDQSISVEVTQWIFGDTYSIRVDDFSPIDDYGGSFEEASSISDDQVIRGTITAPGDEDWFVLETEPNHSHFLEFAPPTQVRVRILDEDADGVIYDGDGIFLTPLHWNAQDNRRVHISITYDGRTEYEFKARSFFDDHSNEFESATVLDFGEVTSGEISYAEDVDTFQFEGVTGEKYVVEIERETLGHSRLKILRNVSDFPLEQVSGEGQGTTDLSHEHTVEVTTTHYITVESPWDELGTYTVRLLRPEPVSIDALCRHIAEDTFDEEFDLQQDGLVNKADLAVLLETRNSRMADANLDGTVDFADFLAISTNFGREGVGWSGGDFDCSGDITFADFLLLSTAFGQDVD